MAFMLQQPTDYRTADVTTRTEICSLVICLLGMPPQQTGLRWMGAVVMWRLMPASGGRKIQQHPLPKQQRQQQQRHLGQQRLHLLYLASDTWVHPILVLYLSGQQRLHLLYRASNTWVHPMLVLCLSGIQPMDGIFTASSSPTP